MDSTTTSRPRRIFRPTQLDLDLFPKPKTPSGVFRSNLFLAGSTERRDYQDAITLSALKRDENGRPVSTLVVLPTNTGKTLTAIMASASKLVEGRIIVIVPSGPLATQQAAEFEMHLALPPGQVATIIGGKTGPEKRSGIYEGKPQVIVGTSQAISRDIQRGRLTFDGISLLVSDESQYSVKMHSHNVVAAAAIAAGVPRLGLTASPGDNYKNIMAIFDNLQINNVEIYFRSSKEIAKYIIHPTYVPIRVHLTDPLFGRIRNRILLLETRALSELRDMGMLGGIGSASDQQSLSLGTGQAQEGFAKADVSRLMRYGKLQELKSGILKYMEGLDKEGSDPARRSELDIERKRAMHALSLHAELMFYSQLQKVIETQSLWTGIKYIEKALGLGAQKSSRAGTEKAYKARIRSNEEFMVMYRYLAGKYSDGSRYTEDNIAALHEHPKLKVYIDTLHAYPESRTMVFTESREQVLLLKMIADSMGIGAETLLGKSQGVRDKDQERAIAAFKSGEARLLISTSAGREGLHIPEADVINYDQVSTAVASIQRRGRAARTSPGRVIDFITSDSADAIAYYLASVRRQMMADALKRVQRELEAMQ